MNPSRAAMVGGFMAAVLVTSGSIILARSYDGPQTAASSVQTVEPQGPEEMMVPMPALVTSGEPPALGSFWIGMATSAVESAGLEFRGGGAPASVPLKGGMAVANLCPVDGKVADIQLLGYLGDLEYMTANDVFNSFPSARWGSSARDQIVVPMDGWGYRMKIENGGVSELSYGLNVVSGTGSRCVYL